MQKIVPFLWFNNQAEEAMNFYKTIFKDFKVLNTMRCGDAGPLPKGEVLVVAFEIDGQEINAMNGGPQVKFNMAVSLFINCDTQEEIDDKWERLSAGGEKSQCGWLMDKFGFWWQIAPRDLQKMISDSDTEKADRVMKMMMTMSKLDKQKLEDAYNGK